MTPPTLLANNGTPTRPYLIRALHEWCTDNGFTPYLAVSVAAPVRTPYEYVKNGEITLNIALGATTGLQLGNEFIEFKARFGGQARDIVVPVDHVIAIYAHENGQGMAFPVPAAETTVALAPSSSQVPTTSDAEARAVRASGGSLKLAATSGQTLGEVDDQSIDAAVSAQTEQEPATESDDLPPPGSGGGGIAVRSPTLKRIK
jgi:stringent starvation protein B